MSHFSMLRVKELQTEYLKNKMKEEQEQRKQGNDDAFWDKVQKK